MSKLRVAVLMGGTSTEREISLSTGKQILAALDPEKYIAVGIDAARLQASPTATLPTGSEPPAAPAALQAFELSELLDQSAGERPDVVFIALHGKGGEDGTIQGMLELLGLPYTGSGVLASALAIDKAMTKRILRAEGIPVAEEMVLKRCSLPDQAAVERRVAERLGYPVVVKANTQGSTVGCYIAQDSAEFLEALRKAFEYDSTVLVEQFLRGTEITAGVLGNESPQALPLIEIVPKGGFYDFEAKYAVGGSEHIIPARISAEATKSAQEYAARTHLALGCRGMCRVDMIVVGDEPYVLEVNTIPGMTPTSLLPDAASAAGIGFSDLLDRIIASALE